MDIFEIDFRGNDIVQELISLIKKIASSINEYSAIAIVRKHGDS